MDLDIYKKNPSFSKDQRYTLQSQLIDSRFILEKKKISDPDLQSLEINPAKRVEI